MFRKEQSKKWREERLRFQDFIYDESADSFSCKNGATLKFVEEKEDADCVHSGKNARENLSSEKGIELRKRRGNEVESIFGDSKLNKNHRRYILRGLKKVAIEAGLHYIAHNIKKIKIFLVVYKV